MFLPSAPKPIPLKTDPSARCREESGDGVSAVRGGSREADMAYADEVPVGYLDYEYAPFSPEVVLGRKRWEMDICARRGKFQ